MERFDEEVIVNTSLIYSVTLHRYVVLCIKTFNSIGGARCVYKQGREHFLL